MIPLFILFIMYFTSNQTGGSASFFIHWSPKHYVFFILIEVGLYFILIYNKYNKSYLYWASLILLLLVPIFSITNTMDFCARASIPGSFILAIMTSQYVIENKGLRRDLLFLLLGIALTTPYAHIATKIRLYRNASISTYQQDFFTTLNQNFENSSIYATKHFPIQQYLSDDDSLFYKYISKIR